MPLILIGKDYWKGCVAWLKEELLGREYIDKGDLKLFHIVNKPEEAIEIINTFYKRREENVNFI